MYGSLKANAKVVEIVKKMQDETYDGALTLMKFEEHAKYDKLLVPMFNMQLHLRERIFGKQFWGNEAEKRDRLYGDIAGNLKTYIEASRPDPERCWGPTHRRARGLNHQAGPKWWHRKNSCTKRREEGKEKKEKR